MQSALSVYFQLGFDHILDWDALDHLLFLLVLGAGFGLKKWKPVLLLATAFTLGHSLTLFLTTYDVLTLPTNVVEAIIPLTIFFAALGRFVRPELTRAAYGLTAVYGLVHGMGFSGTLRASLPPGFRENLWEMLLGFNLGVEVGQLLVLLGLLLLNELALRFLSIPRANWVRGICAVAGIWSLILFVQRVI